MSRLSRLRGNRYAPHTAEAVPGVLIMRVAITSGTSAVAPSNGRSGSGRCDGPIST